jgi:hypothetical protein
MTTEYMHENDAVAASLSASESFLRRRIALGLRFQKS